MALPLGEKFWSILLDALHQTIAMQQDFIVNKEIPDVYNKRIVITLFVAMHWMLQNLNMFIPKPRFIM